MIWTFTWQQLESFPKRSAYFAPKPQHYVYVCSCLVAEFRLTFITHSCCEVFPKIIDFKNKSRKCFKMLKSWEIRCTKSRCLLINITRLLYFVNITMFSIALVLTIYATDLNQAEIAASLMDRLLLSCIDQAKPVTLFFLVPPELKNVYTK